MNSVDGVKRLYECDGKIGKFRAEVAGLADGHKELEVGISKMIALAPKVAEGLAKAQVALKGKEAEVQEIEAKLTKTNGKLKQATTTKAASAVQLEITALRELMDAAENVVLEAMEKEEQAQAMVDKVAGGKATLEKKLLDHNASKDAKTKAAEASIAELMPEREKWRGYIDEDDLKKYDKAIGDDIGKRIVAIVEEACTKCDRHFAPDERETLMRHNEKLHICRKCGALMIYEGAIGI